MYAIARGERARATRFRILAASASSKLMAFTLLDERHVCDELSLGAYLRTRCDILPAPVPVLCMGTSEYQHMSVDRPNEI